MIKPVLNLDMDGVIADFVHCMAAELKLPPEKWAEPVLSWDLTKAWGLRPGEFDHAFRGGVDTGRVFHPDFTPCYPEAAEATRALAAAGWSIHIVTALPSRLPDHTRARAVSSKLEFLIHHAIPFEEVHFTSHGKTHVGGATATVDDHPDLGRWTQPGIPNFLFDRPWNRRLTANEMKGAGAIRADWPLILETLS